MKKSTDNSRLPNMLLNFRESIGLSDYYIHEDTI